MPHLIHGIALGNYAYEAGGGAGSVTEVVQSSSGFYFRDRFGWNGTTTTQYPGYGPDGTIAVIADRAVTANMQDYQSSCSDLFGMQQFLLTDNNRGLWVPVSSLNSPDLTDLIIHAAWTVSTQDYSYAVIMIADAADISSGADTEYVRSGLNRRNPTGTPGQWVLARGKIVSGNVWAQTPVSYGAVEMAGDVHQSRLVLSDDGGGGIDYDFYAKNLGQAVCYNPGSGNTNYMTPYSVAGELMVNAVVDVDLDGTAKISYNDASPMTPTHVGIGTFQKNPTFGNFFICGKTITVNNLPSGWQAGIDGHDLVSESAGVVSFDASTWYLPATTLTIYDEGDVEQFSITPSPPNSSDGCSEGGGIYGGDVYTCQ